MTSLGTPSIKYISRASSLAAVVIASALALFAAGCGAGTGAETGGEIPGLGQPPVVATRSFSEAAAAGFAPNYRDGLETLRRWPKTSLRVFIRAVGDGRDRTVPAQEAIRLWQQATEGFFSFELVGIEERADVVLNFVGPERLSEGAVGYTTVTYQTPGDRITHAEVYVNKGHPDEVLTQVVSHELGHALGVDGHSRSDFDLMYPRLRLPTRVSESDVNTVYLAYREVISAAASASGSGAASNAVTRSAAAADDAATHTHSISCDAAGH